MKFICQNPDCPDFGKEFTYLRNEYKYVDGVLLSNNAVCPKCGQIRKEINPDDNVPLSEKNIDLLHFDMASPEQRKEMLKKRSHEHFKEKIEPYKKERLHQATEQFKEASRV